MIPLIAFDDFRDPPTISSFYKQIWVVPPLNPSKFSAIPPFGFSVTSDSPFCSPKIKWSPLKFSAPLPKAINNDQSLTTKYIHV